MQSSDYTALRRAGWRAIDAYRATRHSPAALDIAEELADAGAQAHEWTAGPYSMRATIEPDNIAHWEFVTESYGTFTDDTGADVIDGAQRQNVTDYHRFRPEYSIADRIVDARAAGMTRAGARADALMLARLDMLRAQEAAFATLTVTASLAGVELGSASVGGVDVNPDPSLPYGVGRSLSIQYIADTLADLIAEAIATADEERPRIAAALAETAAIVAGT